jgi:hypothetical protein
MPHSFLMYLIHTHFIYIFVRFFIITSIMHVYITTRYTIYSFKIKHLYSVNFKRNLVYCNLNADLQVFPVSVIFHILNTYI